MLETGYRLPPPLNCPKVLHKLMLSCWSKKMSERPSFQQIVNILHSYVEQPTLISDCINCKWEVLLFLNMLDNMLHSIFPLNVFLMFSLKNILC